MRLERRSATMAVVRMGAVALIVALAASPLLAAAQQWLVVPGRSYGPIRLGMTTNEVLRVVGAPTSRTSDSLWLYETPLMVRVEYQQGRVRAITTWDLRARTAEGIGPGSPASAVIRGLGGNPEVTATPSGRWLYSMETGLAVFVQGDIATALAVIPRSSARDAVVPPGGATPQVPRAAPPHDAGARPPGPPVVIDGLTHTVSSTVELSGTLRNTGQIARLYVAVVASARTFKDVRVDKREVVAEHLAPGQRMRFAVDLGRDLLRWYQVRLSYSPMQSGDQLPAISGTIRQSEYGGWTLENLSKFVRPRAEVRKTFELPSITRYVIKVTYSAVFPAYARVNEITIRVRHPRWIELVTLTPERTVVEIVRSADVRQDDLLLDVVSVRWELDF